VPTIFSQSVIRLRAPQLRDATSGIVRPQRDWANADTLAITGVSVQPTSTTETRDNAGVQATNTWRLYSRRGSDLDIQAGDRVVWQGQTLDVLGRDEHWHGILDSGVPHHVEITLRIQPVTRQASSGVAAILHDNQAAAQNSLIPGS